MGLFNKIKNILFEDDEMEDIPVYTKEEKNKEKDTGKKVRSTFEESSSTKSVKENPYDQEPIKVDTNKHFNNIKRDIDSYDENVIETSIVNPEVPQEELPKPKAPEKKESPFLSFDEAEFERFKSPILSSEEKTKDRKKESLFKKNSTSNSSYQKESNGKRPFRPSPVISPVYGILDKNYTKDDIVDKMDGLKREIIKPVVRKEIQSVKQVQEETFEVNIDNVRKKAFGELEEMEKRALDVQEDIPYVADFEEEITPITLEQTEDEVTTYTDKEIEQDSILEDLKKDILDDEETVESILDKEPLLEETEEIKEEVDPTKKMRMLDDMEKTSTLQILDDIEKELNAIKPITKDYKEDIDSEKEQLEKNDTLENDLFDLIDSMYEEGEEEEDDD